MLNTKHIKLENDIGPFKERYYRFKAWLYDKCSPVLYLYWEIIPYDLRPGQLWYRLKCFLWHRYTTVKPRTLKFHTWCDRDALLEHCMFEILSQFIEKECSPGIVDWDWNEQHRHVRKEMQEIYDWWHKVYLIKQDGFYEKWHDYRTKHCSTIKEEKDDPQFGKIYTVDYSYDTPENKITAEQLFREANDAEVALDTELHNMMKRLVDIHRYMWT